MSTQWAFYILSTYNCAVVWSVVFVPVWTDVRTTYMWERSIVAWWLAIPKLLPPSSFMLRIALGLKMALIAKPD